MPTQDGKPSVSSPEPDASEEPKPAWQYRQLKDLGINKHMVEVIKLTLKTTETEADALRRKLERIQYGS